MKNLNQGRVSGRLLNLHRWPAARNRTRTRPVVRQPFYRSNTDCLFLLSFTCRCRLTPKKVSACLCACLLA